MAGVACAATFELPVVGEIDCGAAIGSVAAVGALTLIIGFCAAVTSDSNSNISFGKAQPKTLSAAEEQALADYAAGRPYDRSAYNSALQKVKYNEKIAGTRRSSR